MPAERYQYEHNLEGINLLLNGSNIHILNCFFCIMSPVLYRSGGGLIH